MPTFLFFCLASGAFGQNLIRCGDFECAGMDSGAFTRNGWYTTDGGIPYILSLNQGPSTSLNPVSGSYGKQMPFNGKSLLRPDSFVHSPFTQKLERGKSYCFTMYICMDEEGAAKGEFGVLFARTIIKGEVDLNKYTFEVSPMTNLKPTFDTILLPADTANWVKFCRVFKAKGEEKYLVLGEFASVFKNNENTNFLVDAISLYPVLEGDNNCCLDLSEMKKGNKYTFRNLNFKSASFKIEESSVEELCDLADFLKQNPEMKIKISGHTDNTGNPETNLTLSKNRAKSVYDYLISKGIKAARMTYNGFGDTKPLAPNTSETNKGMNRRVEVEFY